MEPHFRNYQINHKFQGKDSGYFCWKLRKKKVKHEMLFKNYSSRLAHSPQYNQNIAGKARAE